MLNCFFVIHNEWFPVNNKKVFFNDSLIFKKLNDGYLYSVNLYVDMKIFLFVDWI